jgi:hypothetical protein
MSLIPTKEQVDAAIKAAADAIKAKSQTSQNTGSVTDKIANTIYEYQDSIQGMINGILQSKGAITQKQLDDLDEQVRLLKKTKLEQETKSTYKKIGLYVGGIILAFGALYLLTREK